MTSRLQRRERGAPYDRVADFYDGLATVYSAGGIARAKSEHLKRFNAGQSLLYAGAGTGSECVAAARLGIKVSAVDLSQAMLARCEAKAQQAQVEVELHHADIRTTTGRFDAVVAPFFLNVFAPSGVESMMRVLAERVRPGGQLLIVDFSAPSHSPLLRLLQNLYYLPPLLFFWVSTGNAWHGVYHYEEIAKQALPDFQWEQRLTTHAWGLPLFETLCWRRTI